MKKLIAILCLAAFTGGAYAVSFASFSNTAETAVIVKASDDKDKDKKKKKNSEKACCSKDAAKSCDEGAKGNASAESGNAGATKAKSCCSQASGKSCAGGSGEKASAPTGKEQAK
ncbi:MAG: hypothetical protein WED33_07460 [Bacteroidia bacterium]